MENTSTKLIICSCCKSILNKRKFSPQSGILKENFFIKEDLTVCFECAGFYLYETYLKNTSYAELKTITSEIKQFRKDEHKKSLNNETNNINEEKIDKENNEESEQDTKN